MFTHLVATGAFKGWWAMPTLQEMNFNVSVEAGWG